MSKVIPKIFNGDLQLIISETFCCAPSKGIQVILPITSEKNLIFKFVFKIDRALSDRNIEVLQEDSELKFVLTNFVNSLGTSLSSPFSFNIGKENFSMQIFGIASSEDIICFTISVFKGKNA